MQNSSFRAKKSLGQNFLTSEGAVFNIIETSAISHTDTILEIGPGKGFLTEKLLEAQPKKVIAIEKDRELVTYLTEKFSEEIASGRLELTEGDVLDFEPKSLRPYKLIANIPYNITGEIIRKFLTSENKPLLMTLLVQKEVAERIVAKDGKESVLSLSVKFFGIPTYIQTVKRGSFNPSPNVDSAIIRVEIQKTKRTIQEDTFFKAIKAGFSSKRKKLISNLSAVYEKSALHEAFSKLSLDENTRAEDMPLEKWRELIKLLSL